MPQTNKENQNKTDVIPEEIPKVTGTNNTTHNAHNVSETAKALEADKMIRQKELLENHKKDNVH